MQIESMERIGRVTPWWERSKTYGKLWKGDFFDKMTLNADDDEEQHIQEIRNMLLERPQGTRGYISVWRAKLMTDSYRQTEGQPSIIRKAKAFKNVCEHIPIPYIKHHLLMGDPASQLLATEIEQEFFANWLNRDVYVNEVKATISEIDALRVRGVESWIISDEDIKVLREYILPYWQDICHESVIQKEIDENYPYIKFEQGAFVGGTTYPLIAFGVSHTTADFASVLSKGLKGIKEEIREELKKIDVSSLPSNSEFDRIKVYEAMLICAEGIIAYANRCADIADKMAAIETDAKRQSELVEMARICRKVPENKAESWWEAIQSWHFLHNAIAVCEGGGSHCAGRFDQYMYPYLKKDLESGKITKKFAQALLECLFLKIRQRKLLGGYKRVKRVPAMRTNDKINISGVDSKGQDATNELSFMLLEAHAHVHLDDPVLALRVHRDTPDDILRATLQVLRLGSGIPHIINDEAIIPSLVNRGITLAEARNYSDIGCQENATDPNTSGADTNPRSNAGYFNLPKMVHLALYDGVEKVTGIRAGPPTGSARDFTSMEEFFDACKKQIEYTVHVNCIYNNLMDWAYLHWHPVPVLDLMHPGPRKNGIDYMDGGCKYNWTGAIGVGLGTAADSLAAIEWMVYDKKECTMDDLIKAMDSDWVGYEQLREKCRTAPKYGNDDNYADKWAVRLTNTWMDAYEKHKASHGGIFVCGLFSLTSYVFIGSETWATPDGRKKGEALSSAADPSNGADLEGPTRLHKSAVKLDTWRLTNGLALNCKFTTATVAGERELSKWAQLVRTYIILKGQTIQYTVVDGEALKAAQKHPDEYRDLIVRTGGYSALFVELSKEIQDSIIARTEHQL